LIRGKEDLLKDKDALLGESYTSDSYRYQTKDKFYHLIINDEDVLMNKKVTGCDYYTDNNYAYKTEDWYWHLIKITE